jgi:hypothetical protein
MPYVSKGDLTDLFEDGPTRRAARRMAATGGERMTARVKQLTPKDTHKTAESWETIPVEPIPHPVGTAYRSGAHSDSHIALFLDHGVDPHSLMPKNAEALTTEQGPRASADHPGFGGVAMTGQAAAEIETHLDEVLADDLAQWAAEQEAAAD